MSLAGITAADSEVDQIGSCHDHENGALELDSRMLVLSYDYGTSELG